MDSNNTLVSKRNIWQSNDTWNFSAEENFRIEKYSNNKVLGATIHGKVIEQNFVENKAEQLWKKGVEDDEGYFTLKNFENSKLMTAISKYGLETKGKLIDTFNDSSNNLPPTHYSIAGILFRSGGEFYR